MKKLTIILFFISSLVNGQNLVLNPSFEAYNKCPWQIGRFSNNVKYWSIPNLGTTDFFSTCSRRIGTVNYNGNQNPKDGENYAGFYLYSPDNYREYIQGELYLTLEANKKYILTFYISLADKSTHALKNISVLFAEDVFGFKRKKSKNNGSVLTTKKSNYEAFQHISETYIKPKRYTKKAFKVYDIEAIDAYSNKDEWIKVSLEFEASGFESYFIIGNFQANKKTQKKEVLKTVKESQQFSYYYIDDISIEPIEKEPEIAKAKEPEKEVILKPNEIYILKNVLFDFDKSELLDISVSELDKLYNHLTNHSKLNIEIHGHTDNVGLETRNQELSEQRAKAVADYLISKGLDTSRIKSFGFGSTQPIATNGTEDGRQQNRRVAFKLIK